MFLPPDRQRHSSLPPARAFVRQFSRLFRAAAWHGLHPEQRQRYIERVGLGPLRRIYARTADGWQCPIFYVQPKAGGSGEPVLLSHGLGMTSAMFRLGRAGGLASELHRHGYAVYFLNHRGSPEAIAPLHRTNRDVESVWSHDIPAVLEKIRVHSGYPKVHWIGHGFGGQLGVGYAALQSSHGLATLVTLGSPVRFSATRTHARMLASAMKVLPAHQRLPNRRLARWLSLWVDGSGQAPLVVPSQNVEGTLVRTVMSQATEDTPIGMLRDVVRWMDFGEITASRGRVSIPALMADVRLPHLRFDAEPEEETWEWGDEDVTRIRLGFEVREWDFLLARDAHGAVMEPIIQWLSDRRRLAWSLSQTSECGIVARN